MNQLTPIEEVAERLAAARETAQPVLDALSQRGFDPACPYVELAAVSLVLSLAGGAGHRVTLGSNLRRPRGHRHHDASFVVHIRGCKLIVNAQKRGTNGLRTERSGGPESVPRPNLRALRKRRVRTSSDRGGDK